MLKYKHLQAVWVNVLPITRTPGCCFDTTGWCQVVLGLQLLTAHLCFRPPRERCKPPRRPPQKRSRPHPIKWQTGLRMRQTQLCCSLACQLMELCLQLGCTAVPHGSVPPLRRESRGKISFSLSLPVQVRALNFALQRRDSAAYDNGINSWNTLSAGGGQTEESAKENYTLGLEEFSLARVLLKDTLAVLFTWWVTFCRQTSSCICHFLVDNER